MGSGEQNKGEGRQQRRDAYDWAVLVVAILAFVAAGVAAWFTWQQADIARDNEQRALRAYVVVTAELAAERDTGRPVVSLKAENMGQTPVYDLVYIAGAASLSAARYDPLPRSGMMRADCGPWEGRWQGFMATFSKAHTEDLRVARGDGDAPTMDAAFADASTVYAYGTACYRDIFGAAHAFRFCYRWHRPDEGPGRCDTRMQ